MANRYWVGGSGTWDASDQSHWSSVTGPTGDAPQSVPTSVDDVIFNTNSGSGTVTVNGNHTIKSLSSNFVGTTDWDANDNNLTVLGGLVFSDVSALVRTLKLGDGNTFQCDSFSLNNGAALTWTPGTALIKCVVAGAPTTSFSIAMQTFTFPNVQVGPDTSWPLHTFSNAPIITNLALAGPVKLRGNITITVTDLTVTTSAKGQGVEARGEQGTQTWALTNPATFHWSVLRNLNFSGAAARAYNSMNGGGCTNVTFSTPKYGRILGG